MAAKAFLKIEGVKGTCRERGHEGWIEVLSFAHGMTYSYGPIDSRGAGFAAAGVEAQDLTITKLVDASSPSLYQVCSTGSHLTRIELEIVDSQLSGSRFLIRLSEAVISGVSTRGSFAGEIQGFTESLSFSYARIEWSHIATEPDGSAGGRSTAAWDLRTRSRHG
jgi:type VI secretion system secreted protein Hcp